MLAQKPFLISCECFSTNCIFFSHILFKLYHFTFPVWHQCYCQFLSRQQRVKNRFDWAILEYEFRISLGRLTCRSSCDFKNRELIISSRRFWGHKRRPEVTRASVNILCMCLRPWGQVAETRTPLLRFKIEREILVLESSRLGKNYLVISDIVIKLMA